MLSARLDAGLDEVGSCVGDVVCGAVVLDLCLDFGLSDQPLREGLEISCEKHRMCPTSLLAPQTAELVRDRIIGGLGQTRVLAFAELVVANSNLPDYDIVSSDSCGQN